MTTGGVDDVERIPVYCPLRYYYEHYRQKCFCDQPYMCDFCIEHWVRVRRRVKGACCDYHILRLRPYLEHCVSDDEKAASIEEARQRLAVDIGLEDGEEVLR